jgi:hypothetical protein
VNDAPHEEHWTSTRCSSGCMVKRITPSHL